MNTKINYITGLDSLRAFSVMLVLMLHGSYGFFKGGWIGVDIFFVLSGFLITSILYNEYKKTNAIRIKRFYLRRILRLFPPLFTSIILAVILWQYSKEFFLPGYDLNLAIKGALFYFTNILPGEKSGNMSHFWSLAVEEHFYLIWPIITAYFLFRCSLRNANIILIVIIILISIFRIYAFYNKIYLFTTNNYIDFYRFTFCRSDGLLFGSLLALNQNEKWLTKTTALLFSRKNLIYLCLFIFLIIGFQFQYYDFYFNNGLFILSNILCFFTIILFINLDDTSYLNNKYFKWIGIRSYGIYTFHFPIFLFFERYRINHDLSNFILITICRIFTTFFVAGISYRFMENPILKLKTRII